MKNLFFLTVAMISPLSAFAADFTCKQTDGGQHALTIQPLQKPSIVLSTPEQTTVLTWKTATHAESYFSDVTTFELFEPKLSAAGANEKQGILSLSKQVSNVGCGRGSCDYSNKNKISALLTLKDQELEFTCEEVSF